MPNQVDRLVAEFSGIGFCKLSIRVTAERFVVTSSRLPLSRINPARSRPGPGTNTTKFSQLLPPKFSQLPKFSPLPEFSQLSPQAEASTVLARLSVPLPPKRPANSAWAEKGSNYEKGSNIPRGSPTPFGSEASQVHF